MSDVAPFDIQGIKIPLLQDFGQYADLQGGVLNTNWYTPWSDVIQSIKADGANNVTLMLSAGVLAHYDDNAFDPSLRYMPSDATVRALAEAIQAAGLSVTINLFAHVASTITGTSTGQDRPHPTDPALWMQNFGASVLHWAGFAQDIGALAFIPFGDETQHLLRDPTITQQWIDLTASIRATYSGILTTNWWTPGNGDSITSIPASVIEQLDMLGLGLFPNLTHDTNASQEALEASYSSDVHGNDVLDFIRGLGDRYDKPVWITDKAFHSFDGAAADEGRIFDPTIPLVQDLQEQVRLYESFLHVMTATNDGWLAGVSFQNFNNFIDGAVNTARFLDGPLSESPQNKPAEAVLAAWFNGLRQGPGITVVDDFHNGEVSGGYGHDTLTGGAGQDTLVGAVGDDLFVPGPANSTPLTGYMVDITLRGVLAGGATPVVSILDSDGHAFLTHTLTASLDPAQPGNSGPAEHLQFLTDDPAGFTIREDNWAFLDFSPQGNRFVRIEGITVNGVPLNLPQSLVYVTPEGQTQPGGFDSVHGGRFDVAISAAIAPVVISPSPDNDHVYGGDGIDTVQYAGVRAGYSLAHDGSALIVADTWGFDGNDTLAGVERLRFADGSIAMDLDGHAGTAAKVLASVFGAGVVDSPYYAGIALSLVDSGMTPTQLMSVALDFRLGAGYTAADMVALVYQNLAGQAPSPGELAYFVSLTGPSGFTPVALALLASDTPLNLANIDFAGLQSHGWEFM